VLVKGLGLTRFARVGVGSASLQEIERKAAADGIELIFDTLRTNEGMIGLARGRGFRLELGFEPRLVRIQKRLDTAPDLPCAEGNCRRRGATHRLSD
jgi:hypothetical protein